MLNVESRGLYGSDHHIFRDSVRRFLAREFTPNYARWEAQGLTDRSFWRACGDAGLLCPSAPVEFGGGGQDFTFNAVIDEEIGYHGILSGASLQSDVVADYVVHHGSPEQLRTVLPRLASGDWIGAIAMTEPGTGSDLQAVQTRAVRDGADYVLSGAKTFISNGQQADIVVVVAKTDPDRGAKGISLFLVEAERAGFRRGRNLDKIGLWAADTAELFFDEVRLPAANLLGQENQGFAYLMAGLPQERLSIAIAAQAGAQRAFDEGLAYAKGRKAFGQTVFDFQNTRFTLADLKARLQVGWAHLDWAIARHVQGALTTAEASAAKYWHTETQWLIVDAALQLHGGAGYMNEYPIARLWRDARAQRIYGGASEIMREVIGRAL